VSTPEGPDGPELDRVAAALRADAADVGTLARVLSVTLADALPPGTVEVQRRRSVSDRLAGRDGHVEAVIVSVGDHVLTLRQDPHRGATGEDAKVVRGVVISRRQVGLDEWVRVLAEQVAALASESQAARDALERLLGG
jgi:hypothetical protein